VIIHEATPEDMHDVATTRINLLSQTNANLVS
jgi:hypothetical protein